MSSARPLPEMMPARRAEANFRFPPNPDDGNSVAPVQKQMGWKPGQARRLTTQSEPLAGRESSMPSNQVAVRLTRRIGHRKTMLAHASQASASKRRTSIRILGASSEAKAHMTGNASD